MLSKQHYLLLFAFFITLVSTGQIFQISKPGIVNSCGNCSDPQNNISNINSNTFRARSAQAYYWEICSGSATIIGSNTGRTVEVSCLVGTRSTIKLVQFINGNCIESCESFTCSPTIGGGGGDCDFPAIADFNNCSETNGPFANQYPTIIDVDAITTNPFNTPALLDITLSIPNNGIPAVSNNLDIHFNGNQSQSHPIQFMVNQTPQPPIGFTTPFLFTFTEISTGNTCSTIAISEQDGTPCSIGPRSSEKPVDDIQIYPNPYIKGQTLKIESLNTIDQATLFDSNGIQIQSFSKIINNSLFINSNKVKQGLYFIKFSINNEIVTKKLLIK